MTMLEQLLTEMRSFRVKIEKAAQNIPDEEAEDLIDLLPNWNPNKDYIAGEKFKYQNTPYKVKEGMSHHSQSDWTPDITYALYERIAREGETGDVTSPISYNGNMVLEQNKYYIQEGILYRCIRDSGIALVHPLFQLIGLYVEVVQ